MTDTTDTLLVLIVPQAQDKPLEGSVLCLDFGGSRFLLYSPTACPTLSISAHTIYHKIIRYE